MLNDSWGNKTGQRDFILLIDWLIDSVSEWVIDWLIDRSIDWMSEWLTYWLIRWFFYFQTLLCWNESNRIFLTDLLSLATAGGVCGRVVNTSNSRSGGPGFKPRPSRCFLRQGTLLTLSLFIQVYKWVPVTYCFDELAYCQRGEEAGR